MARVELKGNLLALPDRGCRLDPKDQQGIADPDLTLVGIADEDQRCDLSPEDIASALRISFQHPDEFRADTDRGLGAGRGIDLLFAGDPADRRIDRGLLFPYRRHMPLDEVRPADKVRHKLPVRIEVDLSRGARLHDASTLHHRDDVRQRQGLDAVMGHINGRNLQLREEGPQLLARLLPQFGVEVGKGLVEEDHLRLGHQRPGQRDPLLLPAAELCGRPVFEPVELHKMERLGDLAGDLLPGFIAGLERIGHVVEDVHVRPDGVGLENHSQSSPIRRDIDALLRREDHLIPDPDLSRVGHLQTDDAAQQRRLAASARTQQREDPVRRDGQIDPVQRLDRLSFRVIVFVETCNADFHGGNPKPLSVPGPRRRGPGT